jgi:hypothetical protein
MLDRLFPLGSHGLLSIRTQDGNGLVVLGDQNVFTPLGTR